MASKVSKRRSKSLSRMQRVEGMLEVAPPVVNKGSMVSNNNSSSLFSLHAMSDRMADNLSSNLLNPKWKRLIDAAAHSLSQRCGESMSGCDADTTRLLTYFVNSDACGGGSHMDIKQCLTGSLEVMDLTEKSTGFVLLGAYHFLQADELKMTAQTWRLLVVTSLLVATEILCQNGERDQALKKLRASVSHWWSSIQADRAIQVFKQRESFKKDNLDHQKIATLYFDLRNHALELTGGQDGDDSSQGAVFEFSQDFAKKAAASPVVNKPAESSRSRSGSHRCPAERSGASLAFSDDSSFVHRDAYTAEGGEIVLSI